MEEDINLYIFCSMSQPGLRLLLTVIWKRGKCICDSFRPIKFPEADECAVSLYVSGTSLWRWCQMEHYK